MRTVFLNPHEPLPACWVAETPVTRIIASIWKLTAVPCEVVDIKPSGFVPRGILHYEVWIASAPNFAPAILDGPVLSTLECYYHALIDGTADEHVLATLLARNPPLRLAMNNLDRGLPHNRLCTP